MAAAYLDVSPRGFGTLVSSGVIAGRKMGERSIRYLRTELDAYIESLPQGKGTRPDVD